MPIGPVPPLQAAIWMIPRSVRICAVRGTGFTAGARRSGFFTSPMESAGYPSAVHTVSRIRRSGSRRIVASAASASRVLIAARAPTAEARTSASWVVPDRPRRGTREGTEAESASWPMASAAGLATVKSRAPSSDRSTGIT